MKKKHTDHQSWYLFDIVVRRAEQRKGIARGMLDPFLQIMDEHQQDVYLETHDPRNVPFYQHFGFRVVEEGTVPRSDLTHYAMLREHR